MEAEIKQLEEELSGKQTSITLETTPSSFFENSESENSFMSLSNSGFE